MEQLLSALRIERVRFKVADPERYTWLQPGRAAEVYANKGELVGWVGNVHPTSLHGFGVDVPVVAFELSVEKLLGLAKRELSYVEVPTLPGVSHDLAIVVDESITCETLVQRITSAGGKLLASVRLFDVYRDPMTASVPSYTAFATSVTSARVGRGLRIMESSICVAVMTGLYASLHLWMIDF